MESLIEEPARMTHCTTTGSPLGVDSSLLRLSIGLEDCDELIADLDHALAGLTGRSRAGHRRRHVSAETPHAIEAVA